jgi:hypothetical protein
MSLHAISAIKNIVFTILKKKSPSPKKIPKNLEWVKKWLVIQLVWYNKYTNSLKFVTLGRSNSTFIPILKFNFIKLYNFNFNLI